LPAVNLCQISELSLVVLKTRRAGGRCFGRHHQHRGVYLCVSGGGFDVCHFQQRHDPAEDHPVAGFAGVQELAQIKPEASGKENARRFCLLGFRGRRVRCSRRSRATSRRCCRTSWWWDFNPQVYERLRKRGVHVVYGDIAQRNVLHHAGCRTLKSSLLTAEHGAQGGEQLEIVETIARV